MEDKDLSKEEILIKLMGMGFIVVSSWVLDNYRYVLNVSVYEHTRMRQGYRFSTQHSIDSSIILLSNDKSEIMRMIEDKQVRTLYQTLLKQIN